jgi:hypothetical protein
MSRTATAHHPAPCAPSADPTASSASATSAPSMPAQNKACTDASDRSEVLRSRCRPPGSLAEPAAAATALDDAAANGGGVEVMRSSDADSGRDRGPAPSKNGSTSFFQKAAVPAEFSLDSRLDAETRRDKVADDDDRGGAPGDVAGRDVVVVARLGRLPRRRSSCCAVEAAEWGVRGAAAADNRAGESSDGGRTTMAGEGAGGSIDEAEESGWMEIWTGCL